MKLCKVSIACEINLPLPYFTGSDLNSQQLFKCLVQIFLSKGMNCFEV